MVTGYDAAGGSLVYSATTATTLSELFAGDRQLTEVGRAFAAGRELPAQRWLDALSARAESVDGACSFVGPPSASRQDAASRRSQRTA